ncbi:MAG: hypothetical protein KAI83_10015 [Thiomargarita sp.]|nr:hypothetical protein [Thiomargarita sp.]
MIRQKHDQFYKQYLGDLLEPDGQVHLNYEIQAYPVMQTFILSQQRFTKILGC